MDNADQLTLVARLLYAALLGGVIGLEREIRGHEAGIRTLALVALGAALYMDVSRITGAEDRIAAQVVTGIGFIGAGVIFRMRDGVRGLTTAATIWAAAALGMAVGRELYLAAALAAIVIFVLLQTRVLTQKLVELLRRLLPDNGSATD